MGDDTYESGKQAGHIVFLTQEVQRNGKKLDKIMKQLPGDADLQTQSNCKNHRNVIFWVIGGLGGAVIALSVAFVKAVM